MRLTNLTLSGSPERTALTDSHRRNLQLTSIAVSLFTGRDYAEWELSLYVLPLVRILTRMTRHIENPDVAKLCDGICEGIAMNAAAFHGDVRKLLQTDFQEQMQAYFTIITEALAEHPDILTDITSMTIPKSRYPALFSMFEQAHGSNTPCRLLIFGYFSEVLESDRIRESEKVIIVMDLAKSLMTEKDGPDAAAHSSADPRQIT